jgi:hypothetical protein
MFIFTARNQTRNSPVLTRNFYGVLSVRELNPDQPDWRAYSLFHGRISHGYQFQSEAKRHLATGYHGLTSGVGLTLVGLQTHLSSGANAQHLPIGVVGLRIGTLPAYGNPGDYIRFYEINPEVTRVANDARYFSYLKDCRAGLEVIPGDARLFDGKRMAIDAFSGMLSRSTFSPRKPSRSTCNR